MKPTDKTPLIGMTLSGLREVASACGMPAFSAKQMAQWLYEKRVTDIEEMTNLSKKLVHDLRRSIVLVDLLPKWRLAPLMEQ